MDDGANAAAAPLGRITTLNPDDVLLGRGNGYSEFIGNQRFRDLTGKRKKEYNLIAHFKPKDQIAHEILDSIQAKNGRFLRLVESDQPVEFILEEGEWEEVSTRTAIEKIKQSLRQRKKKGKQAPPKETRAGQHANSVFDTYNAGIGDDQDSYLLSNKAKKRSLAQFESEGIEGRKGSLMPAHPNPNDRSVEVATTGLSGGAASADLLPSVYQPIEPQALPTPAMVSSNSIPVGGVVASPAASLFGRTAHPSFPFTMPTHPFSCTGPSAASINPRLFLYLQPRPLAALGTSQFFNPLPQSSIGIAVPEILSERLVSRSIIPTSAVASGEEHNDNAFSNDTTRNKTYTSASYQIQEPTKMHPRREGVTTEKQESTVFQEREMTVSPPDHNIREEILSMLSLSNRSTISEQEHALEKANMSHQERAEIRADLFGQMCTTNAHESKKPRLDLDRDSIDFLLCAMRSEIELIPVDKKSALIEAYANGRKDEFSDERLLKFLRCEGMNAKFAAERFVNYWNARRDVFGPKYLERISLAEALRDDMAALETGMFCLLPIRDLSGRPIVYVDPPRHTREGYSSESMLRAIWYVFEVASQVNGNVSNTVVEVVWNGSASIFDYDKVLHDKLMHYHDTCWPTRCAAMHLCCSSPFVARFLRPILRTIRTKTGRARSVYHDVPKTEIIQTLTDYGITAEMLPVEMGGRLNFCQADWMGQRRSTEMKEQEI